MMMMGETDDHQDFDQGDHGTSTTFSQLLYGDDDVLGQGQGQGQGFNNYVFSSCFPAAAADQKSTPKMLCFGDHHLHHHQTQSAAAITHVKTTHPSKSNRKRNGARFTEEDAIVAAQPAATRKTNKKSKVDNLSTSTGHAKVRKEKIGDRISALQQLVSPFGKTDTASVLHEAMGYIRFLQDQVQALCSPYLQQHPPHDGGENGSGSEELLSKELKSRGLCLVPVACIVHVANSSNGADLWSPAAMGGREINL